MPRLIRHLPAIMMSTLRRPSQSVRPLLDAFIAKPFEIPVLLQAIRTLLQDGGDPHWTGGDNVRATSRPVSVHGLYRVERCHAWRAL